MISEDPSPPVTLDGRFASYRWAWCAYWHLTTAFIVTSQWLSKGTLYIWEVSLILLCQPLPNLLMIINPDAPIFSSTAAVCTKELEFRVGVGCSLYSTLFYILYLNDDLNMVFLGILFILFTVTLHVFIVQYRFRSSFPLILVTLVITLSIATVTFTLTMINISAELQPIDITPAGSFVGCQLNPSPAYLGVLFTLQLMVVDTFTVWLIRNLHSILCEADSPFKIYRTWLLYGRSFSVVVFPILCDLGVFGQCHGITMIIITNYADMNIRSSVAIQCDRFIRNLCASLAIYIGNPSFLCSEYNLHGWESFCRS